MVALERRIGQALGRLCLASSRQAKRTLLLVGLVTLVAGYGLAGLSTDADVAGVLPDGEPTTAATHDLAEAFGATFLEKVTFLVQVDEQGEAWAQDEASLGFREAAAAMQPDTEPRLNITDEVYVRAIAELEAFILERTGLARVVSLHTFFAMINWTVAGGEEAPQAAFTLPSPDDPAGAARYQAVDQLGRDAFIQALAAVTDDTWRSSFLIFMPPPGPSGDAVALGKEVLAARDAYVDAVEAGQTRFTVFGADNPPLLSLDDPIASAVTADRAATDNAWVLPLAGAVLLVSLFWAFRSKAAVAVSLATVVVGLVWTFGIMGHAGIRANPLNAVLAPAMLGVGLGYAMHMVNEYLEHKALGRTDREAFHHAGLRGGSATLLATLVAAGSLLFLTLSPTAWVREVGFVAAAGAASLLVLSLTFLPALLTLVSGSESLARNYRPNIYVAGAATALGRARLPIAVVLVVAAGAAWSLVPELEQEPFGDPVASLEPDDLARLEHEAVAQARYGLGHADVTSNLLVLQGDGILTPAAMTYLERLADALEAQSLILDGSVNSLPLFLDLWLLVKDGAPCAALTLTDGAAGAPSPTAFLQEARPDSAPATPACGGQLVPPATQAAIQEEVDALFASPLADLASLVLDHPQQTMSVLSFDVEGASFEEATEAWEQVHAALHQVERQFGGAPPPGVRTAYVGLSPVNHLFVEHQTPWLLYMGVAASAFMLVLVLVATGSPRATVTAAVVMGLSLLFWLALLRVLGIGVGVSLLLPLVLLVAIGSDHLINILWGLHRDDDSRHVFATTGKAALFSALGTAGAFACFLGLSDPVARQSMAATTLALAVTFLTTVLVVPLFYPPHLAHRHPVDHAGLRQPL
ncbi:MAG: MMPL family transporter [Thermoplasmatota archaeon]